MKVKLAAAAAACVVGGLLTPAAHAAAAGGVECGDEISQNLVLTKNLTCTGNGLIIAEGATVTVDLNGHTLRGSGTGFGISNGIPWAEPPSRQIGGLTVRNGTITDFDRGISANGPVDSLHVQSVRLLSNWTGVFADSPGASGPSVPSYISDSVFRDNGGQGAWVGASTIDKSTFDHNAIGVRVLGNPKYAALTSSTFTSNGTGMTCWDGALYVTTTSFRGNTEGIGGGTWACDVWVTSSVFSGSAVGINVGLFGFGWIKNSRFTDSTVGVALGALAYQGYSIEGNTFTGNGASGLYVRNAAGDTPTITLNKFNNNGFAPGNWVTPSGSPLNAGVLAEKGIFTDNLANGNAGYGIEGYGVVDGGGNVAKGNGAPDQCLGVTCTRS